MAFDEEERARILTEARALQAAPYPESRRALGCPLILAAIALAIIAPRIVPNSWVPAIFIAGGIMVLGGFYFHFFGGSAQLSAQFEAATVGLEALAARFHELTADERRSAAVAALYFAHYSDGPSSFMVYKPEQHLPRLGDALPYLLDVERVLLDEGMIYPVFSTVDPTN